MSGKNLGKRIFFKGREKSGKNFFFQGKLRKTDSFKVRGKARKTDFFFKVREKVMENRFYQGQGKIREFCVKSEKCYILQKVSKELNNFLGKTLRWQSDNGPIYTRDG